MMPIGIASGIRGVVGQEESDGDKTPLHRGRGRIFESIVIIFLVVARPSVPEPEMKNKTN